MLGEEDILVPAQLLHGLAQIIDIGEKLADLVAQDLRIEQLLAVLPLVQRARLVEPAVALQADQPAPQGAAP